MTAIDVYITDLSSRLRVGRRARARILEEVRDHLDDALAARTGSDADPGDEQAVALTLSAIGSPASLARAFNVQAGTRAMRRAPVIALAGGIAVVSGFLLAVTTQPRASAPHSAGIAAQLSFFAAAVALQVACVAGVCAAARVIARWRTSEVRAHSRQLVRRCSVISIAALAACAAGWLLTMGLAYRSLTEPNALTLGVGAGIMVVGAAVAGVLIAHLDVNDRDDAPEPATDREPVLGFGEQLINGARRHPVVSCGGIALAGAVSAMAHAETTIAGALPWGVSQAAAVVVGFVLLGPALGLRRERLA